MATPALTVDGVEDLLQQLQKLPGTIQKKYLAAAVREAGKEEIAEIKSFTPRGPTGNLKRSVGLMVEKKRRSATATAVLGYRRSGSGKSGLGYHSWWIENGVMDRYANSRSLKIPTQGFKNLYMDIVTSDGAFFVRSVKGFPGTGKFEQWAESNLPQIRDRLKSVLGKYVEKAIAEHTRRQLRKVK